MRRWLVIAALCLAGSASAEESKFSPRHVAVTGTAVTRVQPDTVVWHISIRRANKELAKAQRDCDEGVKKVLALGETLKLKPEDMQTGHLSIQKIYDRDQAGNQTSFRHFQIDRHLTLKQRDTSKFDEILTQLVATSDIEVSYNLESSTYHKARANTRLEAVKAAQRKAKDMTELLGSKLGRPLRIAEPVESMGFSTGTNNFVNSVVAGSRPAEPDETPGTFAPGSIEIRVSIEVAFELE